jgi:hypothetical protein
MKLNEDTTSNSLNKVRDNKQLLDSFSLFSNIFFKFISQSVNFNYRLRNYEEGIIIDSKLAL